MASSSRNPREGNTQQGYGSGSFYTGNSVGVHGNWDALTFQRQKYVSVNWTLQEQASLEGALTKFASEPRIIRYAKIAVLLRNKTMRDVALRCNWMMKKGKGKRRIADVNPDFDAPKSKARKCMPSYDNNGLF